MVFQGAGQWCPRAHPPCQPLFLAISRSSGFHQRLGSSPVNPPGLPGPIQAVGREHSGTQFWPCPGDTGSKNRFLHTVAAGSQVSPSSKRHSPWRNPRRSRPACTSSRPRHRRVARPAIGRDPRSRRPPNRRRSGCGPPTCRCFPASGRSSGGCSPHPRS